jgi:sodium transport system permease protein
MNWTNIHLIWMRELRDQLRDRRTMFTIVVLPLLLYPMMGMAFLRVTQFLQEHPTQVRLVGVEHLPPSPRLVVDGQFAASVCPPKEAALLRLTVLTSDEWSTTGTIQRRGRADRPGASGPALRGRCHCPRRFRGSDLVPRRFRRTSGCLPRTDRPPGGQRPGGRCWRSTRGVPAPQLFANLADDKSRIAHDRTERILRRWQEQLVREILLSRQLPESVIKPFALESRDVSDEPFRRAAVWSKVLPFILLIWA